MAFAMKGVGSRVPHTYFEERFLLKKHSLTVKKCFALSLGFILSNIVVEMTLNMAK